MATFSFAANSPAGATHLRKRWPKVITVCLAMAAVLGWMSLANANNVSYTYDAAGRLLAAFDGNGNFANYQYDLDDNITAIVTGSTSVQAIFGYSPDYEIPNSNVTIYGNNFGSNPTVTFYKNEPGTVVSATTTAIVATVPNCAPMCYAGPVTVTSSTGTAVGPIF